MGHHDRKDRQLRQGLFGRSSDRERKSRRTRSSRRCHRSGHCWLQDPTRNGCRNSCTGYSTPIVAQPFSAGTSSPHLRTQLSQMRSPFAISTGMTECLRRVEATRAT